VVVVEARAAVETVARVVVGAKNPERKEHKLEWEASR
jgi:hypothetical protein